MESGFQFPAQDWRADIYAALKRQLSVPKTRRHLKIPT